MKQNFSDIWEDGAFYYYFAQCRHDFIHDILHDVYHSHIKVRTKCIVGVRAFPEKGL